MAYDQKYYQEKRLAVSAKYQKAQQKWLKMCELSGQEFIDFQNRVQELNEELKLIEAQEAESKKQTAKEVTEKIKK